jgi:hypothetical protein
MNEKTIQLIFLIQYVCISFLVYDEARRGRLLRAL